MFMWLIINCEHKFISGEPPHIFTLFIQNLKKCLKTLLCLTGTFYKQREQKAFDLLVCWKNIDMFFYVVISFLPTHFKAPPKLKSLEGFDNQLVTGNARIYHKNPALSKSGCLSKWGYFVQDDEGFMALVFYWDICWGLPRYVVSLAVHRLSLYLVSKQTVNVFVSLELFKQDKKPFPFIRQKKFALTSIKIQKMGPSSRPL